MRTLVPTLMGLLSVVLWLGVLFSSSCVDKGLVSVALFALSSSVFILIWAFWDKSRLEAHLGPLMLGNIAQIWVRFFKSVHICRT